MLLYLDIIFEDGWDDEESQTRITPNTAATHWAEGRVIDFKTVVLPV